MLVNCKNQNIVIKPLLKAERHHAELYYYRYRMFNPKDGQFMQRDPIGVWGDPANFGNGYALCAGNPWNGLDPMGLKDPEIEPESPKDRSVEEHFQEIAKEYKELENQINQNMRD